MCSLTVRDISLVDGEKQEIVKINIQKERHGEMGERGTSVGSELSKKSGIETLKPNTGGYQY